MLLVLVVCAGCRDEIMDEVRGAFADNLSATANSIADDITANFLDFLNLSGSSTSTTTGTTGTNTGGTDTGGS